MIATNIPMEMRDGAAMASTLALLAGRNPYAIPGLLETGNVYGIGYPLIAVPFAWALGASFSTLHLVSALGVWGASLLVFSWLRRAGVGRLDAALGAAVVYAGLVYFTGAVARPDGVGAFLMLASVEAMRRGDLDARSYAIGLGLALLGLVCKIYFVWPAFAAAAYVFLRRDRRRGLAYGAAAIAATGLTLLATGLLLPGYAAFVLVANLAASDYDFAYLLRQAGEWLLFELPLGLALAAALRRGGWPRRLEEQPPGGFGLFAAMTGLGVLAIGALGGHTGAHLSYFFQIVSPFAACVALALAARQRLAIRAFRLALPAAIALNAHWFPLDPQRFAEAAASFAEAQRLIAENRDVLSTTEFAGLLALDGRQVAETGHAAYFVHAVAEQLPDWLGSIIPPRQALVDEWQGALCRIRRKIAAGVYDLAFTDPSPSRLIPLDLLGERYRVARTIVIDMPWALQKWPIRIWRRKAGDAETPATAVRGCPAPDPPLG